MIYIRGDIHGETTFLWPDSVPCLKNLKTKEDYLLIAGDAGLVFAADKEGIKEEEKKLDELNEELSYTLLFIAGNHENYARLNHYPVQKWHGGNVHFIRPGIIHLMSGQVYTIDEKRIFTFGGGYSYDRAIRKGVNIDWWEEEIPSAKEYEEAAKNMAIEKEHGGVDVLVSHVPGARAQRVLMPNSTPYYKEAEMHSFIDYLCESLTPSRSYFGHLHIDNNRIPTCPNTIALCNDYYEIFSGECVSRTDY